MLAEHIQPKKKLHVGRIQDREGTRVKIIPNLPYYDNKHIKVTGMPCVTGHKQGGGEENENGFKKNENAMCNRA